VVGQDLVGCRLVKLQDDSSLLWGVIVETEAYSQDDPACHGYCRRSPQNENLFGEPGWFYVYVSYGINHCVNVVIDRVDWANGVLLRAVALPDEFKRTSGSRDSAKDVETGFVGQPLILITSPAVSIVASLF